MFRESTRIKVFGVVFALLLTFAMPLQAVLGGGGGDDFECWKCSEDNTRCEPVTNTWNPGWNICKLSRYWIGFRWVYNCSIDSPCKRWV